MKKRRLITIFVLLLFLLLIIVLIKAFQATIAVDLTDESSFLSILTKLEPIIESFGIGGTLIFTLYQLMDSKEISHATFIVELNQKFIESQTNMQIYDMLQKLVDEGRYGNPDVDDEVKNIITKSAVSNYLTFFETIYILKNRGVLSFEIIDDLFAYRFFLAVHSQIFQDMKLGTQPRNFRNIFKLEKEWLDYRVKIKKTSRARLNDAYKKSVYKGDKADEISPINPKDKDYVYKIRQLRCLVNSDREYKYLLK